MNLGYLLPNSLTILIFRIDHITKLFELNVFFRENSNFLIYKNLIFFLFSDGQEFNYRTIEKKPARKTNSISRKMEKFDWGNGFDSNIRMVDHPINSEHELGLFWTGGTRRIYFCEGFTKSGKYEMGSSPPEPPLLAPLAISPPIWSMKFFFYFQMVKNSIIERLKKKPAQKTNSISRKLKKFDWSEGSDSNIWMVYPINSEHELGFF